MKTKKKVLNLNKAIKVLFFALLVFADISVFSQGGAAINTTGAAADPSAILDMQPDTSANPQGVLIPRMSQAKRNAIVSPAEGLLIYNLDCGNLNVYTNGAWIPVNITNTLLAPVAGTHTPQATQITWNWNAVTGASGYKWNTVNDYQTAVDNGANTSYTQTGLTCETSYTFYVWAYNICGISPVSTLTETSSICPFICGNAYTDSRDGQTYTTILLGTQCWFKKNLNYDQNSYGTDWCYNNDPAYCTTYGRLYDWASVMQGASSSNNNPSGVQGVCPVGWHMPSDVEWCQLENYVEPGVDPSCNIISSRGTNLGTNLKLGGSSGFDALPGGCWDNSFGFVTTHYLYWTSTESDASQAYHRYLYSGYTTAAHYATVKTKGFSVRCVKN